MPSSRGSSWPRNQASTSCTSCIASGFFTHWATWEALYAEYIMWNPGLDETQARIKVAKRNVNNLTYADDTSLVAEIEEELKSLLMRLEEESEKAGLKLNIQK